MHGVTPGSIARARWRRTGWVALGLFFLVLGVTGIFLPVLPTTPFVLLAAWCFSRGSERFERRLQQHPRFGPMVRDWRANRAIPLRARQLAFTMMAIGSAWAWWMLPGRIGWLPGLCCLGVAIWMWRLPNGHPETGSRPSRF